MIDKLKTINPYDETEIDMDANSVAGLVYENTPLIQKVNELVDAVNELQENQNTYWTDIAEIKKELQTRAENVQKIDIGELAYLQKENSDLKDEIDRLETELERTRKALDVAVDALKAITAPALQIDYGMRGYTACKIIAESALTALTKGDNNE